MWKQHALSSFGAGAPTTAPQQSQNERVACGVVTAACISIVVLCGLTLVGWATGNVPLVSFPTPSDIGMMMPLTAANLLLCAASLWLLRPGQRRSESERRLAKLLAAVPLLFGLLVLLEYALRIEVGIDLLLFRDTVSTLVAHLPGRASVAGSLCFMATGLALLWLNARSPWLARTSAILTLVVIFMALERCISYAFGETDLYAPRWRMFGEPILDPMAPKTAACFLVLSLGLLYARPERGFVALFFDRDTSGRLARRLLPAAVLVPVAFGLLGLPAVRGGFYGLEYPLSLVVSLMVVVLLLVLSLSARTIRRVDSERNRVARALAAREGFLRAVFDNAGSGIGLLDLNGKPVATNLALQDMLGYSEGELANLSLTSLLHPEDGPANTQLLQMFPQDEEDSRRFEKRFIHKDGHVVWAQLNVSLARDDQGVPAFWIAVVEDVTERKEAEEAQRRLTAILEATPDFVGIADAQARALFLNSGGRQLTGIANEDLTGLKIPDFHPNWAARRVLDEGLPGAIRDGLWTGESALIAGDGEEIPVSQVILAHRGPGGEVDYFSTIMRDITDRKQTEDAQRFLLEASRAFSGSLEADAVLKSITELVVPEWADYCVIDLVADDGNIERVALAHRDPELQSLLEQLRKYPVGSKQGPGVAEVVRSGEPMLIAQLTDAGLEAMTRSREHLELARKLGPRSLMIVPLLAHGNVIGTISLLLTSPTHRYGARDLQMAQELAARAGLAMDNARLYRQARVATGLRDEVLRVVAHDLRNPLYTILLTAGAVQEQLPGTEHARARESLGIIERSIAQADLLIQDLLDVARLQVGKLHLDMRLIDPAALAREAIDLHRALADARNITLHLRMPERLHSVCADRHRLLRVFSNLIGNALKFSPEGSHVSLHVAQDKHELRFSVEDNGPGISEEDQPHLFDPFWQARSGRSGAGLGLPIAKGIVEAHGGRIWAESQLGKGTTLLFSLPLTGPDAAQHHMAAD